MQYKAKAETAGIIIAAGNQSRFENETPKSLMKYKCSTVLETNISLMSEYIDKIFFITSNEIYLNWVSTIRNIVKKFDNVEVIIINSGGGCGYATHEALKAIDKKYDSVIMCWGDSIQDSRNTYLEMLKRNPRRNIIVPCEYVENPYVKFFIKKNDEIYKVKFSRYSETTCRHGWHDLSIFYYDRHLVQSLLKLNLEYGIICRGIDVVFLDIFNIVNGIGEIIPFQFSKSKSFNTISEYDKIIKGN